MEYLDQNRISVKEDSQETMEVGDIIRCVILSGTLVRFTEIKKEEIVATDTTDTHEQEIILSLKRLQRIGSAIYSRIPTHDLTTVCEKDPPQSTVISDNEPGPSRSEKEVNGGCVSPVFRSELDKIRSQEDEIENSSVFEEATNSVAGAPTTNTRNWSCILDEKTWTKEETKKKRMKGSAYLDYYRKKTKAKLPLMINNVPKEARCLGPRCNMKNGKTRSGTRYLTKLEGPYSRHFEEPWMGSKIFIG
ncbi:hypothetical protein HHI36_017927 [Cryptolaemus montrouzieri]|uniref:Uncharacterized protein n=1 Tax=Cryptolaemus montrouzieri TaxID=559131 RepID=A0ABD2NYQ6_9CUCU